MKRFNPIATPGSGSGATVTVAPEEVETRPATERYGRRGRWRSRHAPRTTRHVTVITLVPNAAQNGLQIYFPGKPDEAVRTELKAAGWRWSSWNVCWYHRNVPENLAWATAFIARHNGQAEVATPGSGPPAPDKIIPLPDTGLASGVRLYRDYEIVPSGENFRVKTPAGTLFGEVAVNIATAEKWIDADLAAKVVQFRNPQALWRQKL